MANTYLEKVAASGERPHDLLPGRTTKTKRSPYGTLRPKEPIAVVVPQESAVPAEPEKVTKSKKQKEEAEDENSTEITIPVSGMPKMQLNFSVKLGSDRSKPSALDVLHKFSEALNSRAQMNTGARVNGSFSPSGSVGGDYGYKSLPEEISLMRTPALPEGDDNEGAYVENVKISTKIARLVLQKLATPQPLLPQPEDDVPPYTQPSITPRVPAPERSTTGETIGVLGGAAAGTGLGALLARKMGMRGVSTAIPVATGAVAGAGLGSRIGNKIQQSVSPSPPDEEIRTQQELQQLLQSMLQQNPQFYEGLREDPDV